MIHCLQLTVAVRLPDMCCSSGAAVSALPARVSMVSSVFLVGCLYSQSASPNPSHPMAQPQRRLENPADQILG